MTCYNHLVVHIKFLQLNIEEGKQFDTIVSYIKEHDFDIIHFQEVTGGQHNFRGIDIFPVFKEALGYEAVQTVYWRLKGDPGTYMSNVTFFKPSLRPVSSHREFLKPYTELTKEQMPDATLYSMSAQDLVFDLNGQYTHFINTHLVWGPTPEDKPYKLEQGKKLYDYVKHLTGPFLLSGDFNVTPDSQIVRWLDELAVNHTVKHGVTNTLNGNLHRVKHLFPEGLAVDFLYTSPSLQVHDFALVDTPDLSDHYGLRITIEI